MKKKTLLTLGVCALALGAVVGAVSARNATLAKAGEGDITVYFKDASWWATDGARTGTYLWKGGVSNTWPGTVMEKVGTDGGHNIWKATIDTGTYENLIFTRYGATDSSDWGAKTVTIPLSDFDPAKPLYDISAVTEPVWGDPGVSGTWVAYDEPAATSEEASEVPVVEPEYYVVGSFNKWTVAPAYKLEKMGEQKDGKDQYKIELDGLKVNDELKVKDADDGWFPSGATPNYKVSTAGDYTLYFVPAGGIEEEGWHEGYFYMALKEAPVVSSEEASSEVPASSEAPVATGLYLRGTAVGGWDVAAANELQEHEGDRGAILNVTFAVGDFKIANADWSQQWGWKYKNDDEEEDHVTVIGGAKDNFEAAEGKDNNIHCKVAGVYDIYLTNNNYISVELHGEPAESSEEASTAEASSAPIIGGYFYVATGNGYEEQYLYTWEGEGGTGHENAKFPGVKLNDIADAYCTEGTNFNGNGGIWKVPASALMEKFKITLKDTDESQPVEERQIETQDLDAAAGIYVAPGAAAGDLNLGAQANVTKAIEDKIVAAENKSVCNVAKADAELLVAAYDALTDKTAIDAATYWTYDVDIKDLTDSTPAAANVTYDKLVEQLRFIAEGGNAGAWNVTNATNNIALIITISIVGVGLVGAGALYLVSKKRKLQK